MSVQNASYVWDSVLGDLQLQVPRPSFETWLKGTAGVSHGEGQFVVSAPSTFVAEMLEHRMYSLISQALEKAIGDKVELRFEVFGSDRPVAVPAGGAADADGSPVAVNGHIPATGHQAQSSVRLNHKYTFDKFIVGKSNELAHAAAEAVAERPGGTYNPLFLYSGVGLGKTHLLHAIGHEMHAKGMSPIYSTAEEFTNEYIGAIREGKTGEFRSKYRNAEALLLDDVQFIIGKEQTQEGFFHTFNALHMAGRQIVITSDRPTASLTLLEDRVRSRLAGGLVVDIQPPDLEVRMAILRAKADETGMPVPQEVLQYLAERIHSNIRELEGGLNRLAAHAQLSGSTITMDLVKGAISDILHSARPHRVSDQQVLDAVCSYFTIDEETIKGRRRDKPTALARQIAMYLMREEANMPLATVGRFLGGRDHTTVMHACQRITDQIAVDSHIKRDVFNLRETLVAPR